MSRNAASNAIRAGITAFEVEIETFWVDKLCKLAPGRTVEVWLTPKWTLAARYIPLSIRVGGSRYNREVELRYFREDAFEALQGTRR